jgi:hypothetical protein
MGTGCGLDWSSSGRGHIAYCRKYSNEPRGFHVMVSSLVEKTSAFQKGIGSVELVINVTFPQRFWRILNNMFNKQRAHGFTHVILLHSVQCYTHLAHLHFTAWQCGTCYKKLADPCFCATNCLYLSHRPSVNILGRLDNRYLLTRGYSYR